MLVSSQNLFPFLVIGLSGETQNKDYLSQHPGSLQWPERDSVLTNGKQAAGAGACNIWEISLTGEGIPLLPAFLLPAGGNVDSGHGV